MRFKGFEKDWNITTVSNEFIFLTSNSLSRDDLNYQSGYRKNIHYGDILTKYTTVKDISDHNVPFINDNMTISGSSIKLKSGDIIIADTAEDFTVGKTIEIYNPNELEVYSGLHTIPLRPINKFSNGYLAYYFNSDNFKKRMFPLIQGIKVYSISKFALSSLVVKYPTLEEQNKIAKILISIDSRISTQMKIIGDLESLRNKINTDIYNKIDFNKKCKLKELCSITTGKLDANAMVVNGKYRFYTCAEKFYYINNYDFDGEALLISGNGANVGYIHYYNGKFNAYQRTYVLQNFKLNAKYINVFLNVFLKHRIEQQKNNGNTPYIKMATLAEMTILIPSIEEQNNIISINDLLNKKISNEKKILSLYEKQKQYLLNKLFI